MDEQQRYYDERWLRESEFVNRLQLERMMQILRCFQESGADFVQAKLRICELGCGRGWLSNALSCLGEITGVDLSPKAVERAAKRWPALRFEHGNVENFRTDRPFDVVVSSEVLEHVENKSAFIDTAHAILKRDGLLILTTPNGKMLDQYLTSGAEIQPVEEWVTRAQLRALVDSKFEIIKLESFLFDQSSHGILRVLSAPKLRKTCRALGIESLRQGLHRRLDFGLHFILFARARS